MPNSSSFKAQKRLDYKAPDFTATDINLYFKLADEGTIVISTAHYKRLTNDPNVPLRLDGENLVLKDILLNKQACKYKIEKEGGLIVFGVPDEFDLTTECEISPIYNTSLMGLYKSSGCFCTQCEPQGFRRITYFLDRPDVLAKYTVTIEGPESGCGVLLSNGNLIESGVKNGRNYAVWKDPFPKPSYLFALVAGSFDIIEDTFTTKSGIVVKLGLYVERGCYDRGLWAMKSIKEAMAWDEQRFNLEYDLYNFNVVAVDFFNFGAMENKSLNIFNSSCVLVNSDTATDNNYFRVQGVIGHEYFHNWTGDRVTLRDWFQLSLKESLTVFRDQEFSSDVNSRVLTRLDAINTIRVTQFAEDAGPMAHPVRPEQVMEMNNFYTTTVYDKGAEVIRMIHTILGEEKFQKGIATYLKRFDGKAVTIEDFISIMETAAKVDLSQFRRWYTQVGTPEVKAQWRWLSSEQVLAEEKAQADAAAASAQDSLKAAVSVVNDEPQNAMAVIAADADDVRNVIENVAEDDTEDDAAALHDDSMPLMSAKDETAQPTAPMVTMVKATEIDKKIDPELVKRGKLLLTLDQSVPEIANQAVKEPLVIPIRTSFLNADGEDIHPQELPQSGVLLLTEAHQVLEFTDVPEGTLPVLLRDFSAPVKLQAMYSDEDYLRMLKFADDPFICVDAQMSLVTDYLHQQLDMTSQGVRSQPDQIIAAIDYVLKQSDMDMQLQAILIRLPSLQALMETFTRINNLDALVNARKQLRDIVAQTLVESYEALEKKTCSSGSYKYTAVDAARRAVHNACMSMLSCAYVSSGNASKANDMISNLYESTDNMTERLCALTIAVNENLDCKTKLLSQFEESYEYDPLTFDKFFSVQAAVASTETVNVVRDLLSHPCFDLTNPNRVRALMGTFGYNNPVALHRSDGMGYLLMYDVVKLLDPINPSMASRILDGIINFGRLDAQRQQKAVDYLKRIDSLENLSCAVKEKVEAALRQVIVK